MKTIVVSVFSCALLAMPLLARAAAKDMTPQEFVDMAAQTDMTEANLGQVAQDNSSSQAVKDYGQMLRTDHTANYAQLTAAATKAGLTVAKGIDEKHDKMIMPLTKLKGTAFDKRFEHEMAMGHEEALAAFQKESNSSQNADIQAYAKATIPDLEKHLTGAKDLMKGKK